MSPQWLNLACIIGLWAPYENKIKDISFVGQPRPVGLDRQTDGHSELASVF